MYSNADITIYNKYMDKATRIEKYKRIVIKKVFFDEKKASNRLQSGLESADSGLVLIPFDYSSQAKYVPYKEYKGIDGTFTLAIGDRVVKGDIDFEITGVLSELDKKYEAFTITSVDAKDFGSPHMRHWEVGVR